MLPSLANASLNIENVSSFNISKVELQEKINAEK